MEHQTAGITAQSTGNLGMPKTPKTKKMVSHHPQSTVFLECRMNVTTGKWDCMRKQMQRDKYLWEGGHSCKKLISLHVNFWGGAWVSLRLCASIWVVTEGGIWFVQSLNSRVERNKKVYGIRRNTSQGGNLKKKKRGRKKKSKMWSQCRKGRNHF